MYSMVCASIFIVLATSSAVSQSSEIVLKTRTTYVNEVSDGVKSGRGHTSALYVEGVRQRWEDEYEAFGPASASSSAIIYRPDTKQIIHLNSLAKTYFVSPFDPQQEEKRTRQLIDDAKSGRARPTVSDPNGGLLTITFDTTDTGERREINGITLRHLRQVETHVPSDGAPESLWQRTERDGWYVRIPAPGTITEQVQRGTVLFTVGVAAGEPRPRWVVKHTGNANPPLGQPATETVTFASSHGISKAVTELIELSRRPIDPALFDVPSGYRLAQQLPRGGIDMEHPATVWGNVRNWWYAFWSRRR